MHERLADIYRSFRSLPGWVQIWVGAILVPANALPFFILDHPVGQAGAAAALFVLATNVPLAWITRGMNAVLSLPHLVAWLPLQCYLAWWLWTTPGASGMPLITAATLLAVNGISLMFDTLDAVRWLRGDRSTPGLSAASQSSQDANHKGAQHG